MSLGRCGRDAAGLAGQTHAVLMTHYRISYNTWRKVQLGDAIRRPVAERLERRMSQLCEEAAVQHVASG